MCLLFIIVIVVLVPETCAVVIAHAGCSGIWNITRLVGFSVV
jgi:hypothetical protein